MILVAVAALAIHAPLPLSAQYVWPDSARAIPCTVCNAEARAELLPPVTSWDIRAPLMCRGDRDSVVAALWAAHSDVPGAYDVRYQVTAAAATIRTVAMLRDIAARDSGQRGFAALGVLIGMIKPHLWLRPSQMAELFIRDNRGQLFFSPIGVSHGMDPGDPALRPHADAAIAHLSVNGADEYIRAAARDVRPWSAP